MENKFIINSIGEQVDLDIELQTAIQEDINIFNDIPESEQDILVSVLTGNGVIITDELFQKLADQENIEIIRDKIEFLLPFLFRVGNFILNHNITINNFVEFLSFNAEYTKNTLLALFSSDSDFFKSMELEKIVVSNIDIIKKYKSVNVLVDLSKGYFLSTSKINIGTPSKDIELLLDIEQLELLHKNIETTLKEIKEFKSNDNNKTIKFYK